jgi:hypothetical protein
MGRWLTLTGFGKVDDLGEDATVPDWMLSKTEKDKVRETTVTSRDIQLRGGIQPDIVILEGWPETEQPPSGPTKTWTSRSGENIAVKLIVAHGSSIITHVATRFQICEVHFRSKPTVIIKTVLSSRIITVRVVTSEGRDRNQYDESRKP